MHLGTKPHSQHALRITGALSCLRMALMAGVATAAVLLPAAPVMAQSEDLADDVVLLERLTVQARRFVERLIDVPVSVSVYNGDQLALDRIETIDDLASRTNGLQQPNYGDDPRTAQPIIRGVGTLSTLMAPDNSTAPTIVDGVPMPAFAASSQLLDVDEVEILRGPQGTLFGRNSTGGAINVRSAMPDGETLRQVTTEIGTDGYRKVEAILAGALTDDLSGRLAVRYNGNGDYIENDHPGQSGIGSVDVGAIKGGLLWTPDYRTEVGLTVGYEKYNSDTGYAYRLRDNNVFQETPKFNRGLANVALNVSHELDTVVLKSTTGITYYDTYNFADNSDGYINSALYGALGFATPASLFTNDGESTITRQSEGQLYQEVRVQSLDDADIRWVIGGALSHSNFNEQSVGTSSSTASINGTRDNTLTSTSAAIFGDIAYPLAERWEIGAGLRYTYDHKTIDHTYLGNGFAGTVASYSQESSRDFNLLSGRLSLSYKPTDDSLLYASIARGTKAGGFPRFTGNATTGLPENGYDATTTWAYEIGAKADLFDGATSVAVTGFYNDVDGEAIFGYSLATNTFPIENFDLRTYGVEAELATELGYGLSLSSGVALTFSEITGIPENGLLAASVGNAVPNVPLWSGNIALNYTTPLDFLDLGGDPEFSATLAYRYVGPREGDTANAFELDAQHIVDARVGLKFDDAEVYVFGENLVDELLEQQGAHVYDGVDSVVATRGRTIGIGMTTKF